MDIKLFPTITGTCSKMDKISPKMSRAVGEPKQYIFCLVTIKSNSKKFCAKHHENILGFSNIYPNWASKYPKMALQSKGNMPYYFL